MTTARSPTPSAILGPFYQADAPLRALGSSILQELPLPLPPPHDATCRSAAMELHQCSLPLLARMWGCVRSAATGRPVAGGATLEVWQSAPNGRYEQQDAGAGLQPEGNLRGRFAVGAAPATPPPPSGSGMPTTYPPGHYAFTCLKPTPYPVPDDGPAGRLLRLLDRDPFRPGHVHFVVSAPGYRTLTTQLFDRDDPYIQRAEAGAGAVAGGDAVFAVKEELLVEFRPLVPRGGEEGLEGEEEFGDGAGDGDEDKKTENKWETKGKKQEKLQKQMHRPRYELEFDFLLVEL